MAQGSAEVLGGAFICEGVTEKVFYQVYVVRACEQLGLHMEQGYVGDTPCCTVTGPAGTAVMLFQSVDSVTQMVHADRWFHNVCRRLFPSVRWQVFLCYDTDEYNADVTKFWEGDWARLREGLAATDVTVHDFAAQADIEDVLLGDYPGVLRFLGLAAGTSLPDSRKGKGRMRKLFRLVARNNAYHAGDRAKPLIESLDMGVVRANAPEGIDLGLIDDLFAGLAKAPDTCGRV